jgi:probable phosphoglycerate mutase
MGADQMVYLLRHGETEWSAARRHTSRTDIPLTPNGEKQAMIAGETLRAMRGSAAPATVWASPRQRAARTAELAGLTVHQTREDLVEWDYGRYEGATTEEIRETVPGWTVWTHPCPDGETVEAVTARADGVLAAMEEALTGGDVVIVGHGHLSRILIARWIGSPACAGVHFPLQPAGITVLGDERGVPSIRRGNLPPLR